LKNRLLAIYIAARLAIKTIASLFQDRRMLSEKINAEKWGAKVLEQIAGDLQNNCGFERIFAQKSTDMKRLFTEYQSVIIMQSATGTITRSS